MRGALDTVLGSFMEGFIGMENVKLHLLKTKAKIDTMLRQGVNLTLTPKHIHPMSTLSVRLIQPIQITTYDTPNGLPPLRTAVKHSPLRAISRQLCIYYRSTTSDTRYL